MGEARDVSVACRTGALIAPQVRHVALQELRVPASAAPHSDPTPRVARGSRTLHAFARTGAGCLGVAQVSAAHLGVGVKVRLSYPMLGSIVLGDRSSVVGRGGADLRFAADLRN